MSNLLIQYQESNLSFDIDLYDTHTHYMGSLCLYPPALLHDLRGLRTREIEHPVLFPSWFEQFQANKVI